MLRKPILLLLMVFSLSLSAAAMTIDESIDYALKHNPNMKAAQDKVEAAAARLNQAVGAFLPTVKLDANYGSSYSQPQTVQVTLPTTAGAAAQTYSFGTDAVAQSHGWSAALQQPVFVAGLFPGYEIAKKSVNLVLEDQRKTQHDIAYNVAVAYFNILSQERFLKLAEDSLAMAQSHLKQVEKMLSYGVVSRADYFRAEGQVANYEVSLTKSLNSLELAKSSFNNVLGRDLAEKVEVSDDTKVRQVALPEYALLVETALKYRPEWRQFLISKQIAAENVAVARTTNWPSLLLSGQTGNRVSQYPTFKSDVNSWSVSGAASWTLFDGFTVQNKVREAVANLEAQKVSEQQVKSNLLLEVRGSYLELKNALETIPATKKAVNYAEENLKVTEVRYASGAGTNIEVIEAQVALTQAKTNYLNALFAIETAEAKICQVIGYRIF